MSPRQPEKQVVAEAVGRVRPDVGGDDSQAGAGEAGVELLARQAVAAELAPPRRADRRDGHDRGACGAPGARAPTRVEHRQLDERLTALGEDAPELRDVREDSLARGQMLEHEV